MNLQASRFLIRTSPVIYSLLPEDSGTNEFLKMNIKYESGFKDKKRMKKINTKKNLRG